MAHLGDIIGDRFGLLEKIGNGGFATVWRALDHKRPEREVALKILGDRDDSPNARERFLLEGELLQRVRHPNIAAVVATGMSEDRAYVATELIRGRTLSDRLKQRAKEDRHIPLQGVAWIARQLASAIDHAHKAGVIHRDLKPQNVMMHDRGMRPFVKLIDFGIARARFETGLAPTTFGRILGTLQYISPEQLAGGTADERSDVFALGCLLFEALTLRRVWSRDHLGRHLRFDFGTGDKKINSRLEVARRILRAPRTKVSELRPGCSYSLDKVLQRALAVTPRERFSSCGELATAFTLALAEPVPVEHQETIRLDEDRILAKLAPKAALSALR